MMKYVLSSLLLLLAPLLMVGQTVTATTSSLTTSQSDTPLSLEEALEIAQRQNLTLSISREQLTSAKAESRQMRSLWYPTLSIEGEYTHSLTEIAAVTSVGEIGEEVLGNLAPIIEGNPLLAGIVEGIGGSTISIPIVPRNTAAISANVMWVVFSGGQRLVASDIAGKQVGLAHERYNTSENMVMASLIEAYFGVELAREVVEVRRSALAVSREHLRQAQRLEAEGIINKAERLVADVGYKQAVALLTTSERDLSTARKALATILGEDTLRYAPSTPLFVPNDIPRREELLFALNASPTMSLLHTQKEIASLAVKAEQARYLPSVALIGHQRLWSTGVDKNLFPRTFVGVGLSWTLFDGLAREGAIAQSKTTLHTVQTTEENTLREMATAVDKYYNTMIASLTEVEAQLSTIALAEELLRVRRKAFGEGMSTSSEVVEAAQMLAEARLMRLVSLYTIDTSLSSLLMLIGRTDNLINFLPIDNKQHYEKID